MAFLFSLNSAANHRHTSQFLKLIHGLAKPRAGLQKELQGIDMNSELMAFCRDGEVKEALILLNFMQKSRISIRPYAYYSILNTCTRNRTLAQGRELYSYLKSFELDQNLILASKLITMFIACGSPVEARLVFDNVHKRDIILWNSMISGYVSCGLCEDALSIYYMMETEGFIPDNFTFPCVLKACTGLFALDEGRKIHDLVLSVGLEDDIFVGNALVDMYAKCGDVEFARQVFDKMPERSVVTWNAMIAGYVQNGMVDEGFEMFHQMQIHGRVPNLTTVVNILPACASSRALRGGREIHGFVRKWGLDLDGFVGNALIDMYAECGSIDEAVRVFEKMSQRDVVSWNAMASGFLHNGLYVDTLELFRKMQASVQLSSFTFVSVLPACGRLRALKQGRELHGCVIKSGFESHAFVRGALLDMYSKCESIEDAKQVFYVMCPRDVVSWNAMIAGYVQISQFEEAFKLFVQMDQIGPKPNSVTIASVLPAFARLAALRHGKEMHSYVVRRGFENHIAVGNTLIDMYAKCGSIGVARLVFNKMSERTLVSWNAMIAGYGMHAHIDETFVLFSQMQDTCLKPDHITFVALLSACSHSGLVDEGWHYFCCMSQVYGITPRMEHYACMVDLLGRAGMLHEANDFINNMPFQPDSSIWGTLLSACKLHCNIELAEKAAEQLFKLEPENTGFYILLSNIYAGAGRWYDVAKVRKMLRDRGLRKEAGCSWIEVDKNICAL